MQYLIATETLLNKICENKNSSSYFGKPMPDDVIEKKLEGNDQNLFYPLMFNFYHTIEMYYKHLLVLGNQTFKKEHKLSDLFNQIENTGILNIDNSLSFDLSVYINMESLQEAFPPFYNYLYKIEKNPDDFYLFLKYPNYTNEVNKEIFQDPYLLGQQQNTLIYYKSLQKYVENLRKFIVGTHRYYCP